MLFGIPPELVFSFAGIPVDLRMRTGFAVLLSFSYYEHSR